MTYTDLSDIRCSNVTVIGNTGNSVYVTLDNADVSDILDGINVDDVVSHYKASDLLNQIGQKEAAEYFGLVEPNE